MSAASGGIYSTQSLLTQFVSLQPYRTLFLHSHIGAPKSIGPRGESTIVKKIVVGNTVPGDVIVESLQHGIDYIELPPALSSMHFSLRDSNGKSADLQGHTLSLTLVVQDLK